MPIRYVYNSYIRMSSGLISEGPIGIERGLAAPPSHTTVHTDHEYGGSADSVRVGYIYPNRSVLSRCASRKVIPDAGHKPNTSPDAVLPLRHRRRLLSTVQAFGGVRPPGSSGPAGPGSLPPPPLPSADCSQLVDAGRPAPRPGHQTAGRSPGVRHQTFPAEAPD
jgi:hypothetical protein